MTTKGLPDSPSSWVGNTGCVSRIKGRKLCKSICVIYVTEGVWQKIEVEIMNVVLVYGEKWTQTKDNAAEQTER